jgi:hypothetical protein
LLQQRGRALIAFTLREISQGRAGEGYRMAGVARDTRPRGISCPRRGFYQ